MDSELERMKTEIDLRVYAAEQGYQLDRRESSRSSSIMRHPNGDKIVVKRGSDGHYVYFSVRRGDDNGTIVDFSQKRMNMSLGAVRKELRPWIGRPPSALPAFAPLVKTGKDRMLVEAEYSTMQEARNGHPYLENERALPASLLGLERFAGRISTNFRDYVVYPNAVFPHFDAAGLCGYEIKNTGFTGFASGGSKGLWLSHELPGDNRLVFCESAIDALSHAVLFPDEHARYASIGGKPGPMQPELIRAAAARMPQHSKIVAAMDADADGAKLADVVRKAVELTGREDLVFVFQEPFGFKDWNDQLRKIPKSPPPPRRQGAPSVA